MENEDNKKIVIDGNQYALEEMPEPLRKMVKTKMETAKTGEETPGGSRTAAQQDFQFQFQPGSGLAEILKLLATASQPPKPRTPKPTYAEATPTDPENEPDTDPDQPGPGAINPSSSSWIIWLAVIILAAFYFFVRR